MDEDDPYQDSGSEYLPTRSPSPADVDLLDILGAENQSPNVAHPTASPENTEEQCKPRKRLRQPSKWKKNIRKEKRAKGEEYVNTKGNTVPSKSINTDIPCKCAQKCHDKINSEQQKELFNRFYAMENFDLQSSYIFSLVKVLPKKRSSISTNGQQTDSRRSNTRVYTMPNSEGLSTTVCKEFFKKIFAVSDGRLSRVLKRKLSIPTPPIDARGRHAPVNKTSEEKIQRVKEFIDKFPKYESHYTLHKSTNRRFLAPDLSLPKMYALYCNDTPESERVSDFMFRKVFNQHFNLSFHAPISDSCKKCDNLKIKIDAASSQEAKEQFELQKKVHLAKADSAKDNYKIDKNLAKEDTDVTVIVFDLMKTLPTPVISTGVCYYKRQLWTYNLGIHDAATDIATMCVWDETVASRGPQEIGSCLLRYIKENVKTKTLILYSDQCGGQNRNIKMATLCQYITSHPNYVVEKIDHKFFVSGHSYLACDQDFGLIEKQKKFFKDIFIPDDWIKVIKAARKKNAFKIMKMTTDDFVSTKKLENNITNRKVTAEKSKVKWLSIQWLLYHKIHPFSIFFKYSNNPEVLFENVNIKKRNSINIADLELDLLYPLGKQISVEKKKDLIELLQYIPPVYHDFYNNIKANASAPNDLYVGEEEVDSD